MGSQTKIERRNSEENKRWYFGSKSSRDGKTKTYGERCAREYEENWKSKEFQEFQSFRKAYVEVKVNIRVPEISFIDQLILGA